MGVRLSSCMRKQEGAVQLCMPATICILQQTVRLQKLQQYKEGEVTPGSVHASRQRKPRVRTQKRSHCPLRPAHAELTMVIKSCSAMCAPTSDANGMYCTSSTSARRNRAYRSTKSWHWSSCPRIRVVCELRRLLYPCSRSKECTRLSSASRACFMLASSSPASVMVNTRPGAVDVRTSTNSGSCCFVVLLLVPSAALGGDCISFVWLCGLYCCRPCAGTLRCRCVISTDHAAACSGVAFALSLRESNAFSILWYSSLLTSALLHRNSILAILVAPAETSTTPGHRWRRRD